MDRTTSFGYVLNPAGERVYVDQNLVAGVNGTDFAAADALAHQEEHMGVIEGAGLEPDATNLKQVLAGILLLIAKAPRFTNTSLFTASAVFVVPAKVYWLRVRLVGAGGGGGAGTATYGGGGGGAGGYAEGIIAVVPGQTIPVTVPGPTPGGVPGGNNGLNGGTTSFGPYVSATGGGGALNGSQFSFGGSPGTGYGVAGTYAIGGGYGSDGTGNGVVFAGNGGASYFGGGGRAAYTGSSPEQNAVAYGAGGGGCYLQAEPGGYGAGGFCIVEF